MLSLPAAGYAMASLPERLIISRTACTAVIVYAVVLTYLLLTPSPLWFLGVSGQVIETAVDRTLVGYVQHGLAYSLLACLLIWATRFVTAYWQAVWMLVAMAHGIAAEWLQCFVPYRHVEWSDGMANALGVGLGWLCASLILRKLRRPLGHPPECFVDTLKQ